jgi:stearoyl-CoA desaturase (delta-9 desaturase)
MAHRIAWRACLLFVLVHLVAVVGVACVGGSPRLFVLAAVVYAARMFALSAGVHRYLAHRSFETSRAFQLVLALVATTAAQLGVLWWASQHRIHHRHADRELDPHGRHQGFWFSHVGWFLVHTHDATAWDQIPDLSRYPELRWLDRYYFVPTGVLVAALALFGGGAAVIWGFAVSTVALWHASFALTSVAHWIGTRRFATRDLARNNAALALLTFGEGWHNNHHHRPGAAKFGVAWWELDITFVILRVLAAVGIVWNLRAEPARAIVIA